MSAAQVRELPKPQPSGLTMEIVTVTPAMAETWLGKNPKNRNIRQGKVSSWARAIERGEWIVNGETIKFAADGHLLDGQHRLLGCIQAGKSFRTAVVRGLPNVAQDTMDTGAARTAGDQAAIHGYPNAQLLAAAAKIVILWETGRFYVDHHRKSVSHTEILDFIAGNELIAWACAHARTVSRDADLRPSVAAAALYELMKVDDDKAQTFFDRIADGVELPAGSPILALRARLRQLKDDRVNVSNEELMALVFRAWNAWRSRKKLSNLPLRHKGDAIQCPEPK